jgi:hypothetical protein
LDDAAVDIRWPLSPPRMRSASQLQRRLSEERESTILRARAASGGEWVRLAGTFEERDRASDLWTRESEFCRWSGSDILSRDSEWSQKEKRDTQ